MHVVPVSRSFHTVYLQTTAGHGTHRTGRRGEGVHGLAYTLGRHSSAPRLSTTRTPCRRYPGKQHLEITDVSLSPVTKACTTLDIDGLQDTWLNLQINSQRHEVLKDKARHVCLNATQLTASHLRNPMRAISKRGRFLGLAFILGSRIHTFNSLPEWKAYCSLHKVPKF